MSDPVFNPTGLIDRAALEFLRSKKLLPGFSHYDVWLYQHAVAFTVAKMMDADLLAEVKDALETAQRNGTSFEVFKQRLKPYLMSRGWWGEQVMTDPVDGVSKLVQLGSTRRLRVIFQTNMATAFAAGQWARNHGDRLGALQALMADKHGKAALAKLIEAADDHVAERLERPNFFGAPPPLTVLSDAGLPDPQGFVYQYAGRGHQIGVLPVGKAGSIEWVEQDGQHYLLEYTKAGVQINPISAKQLTKLKADEIKDLGRIIIQSDITQKAWKEKMPFLRKADFGEADIADKQAAFIYTTNEGYRFINPKLIEHKSDLSKLDDVRLQFVRALDALLSRAPAYQGTVFRRLQINGMPDAETFLNVHQPGALVRYSNYTSTSRDKRMLSGDADIVLTIHSRSGVDISRLSQFEKQEAEVLLPRQAVYRVVEHVMVGGRHRITLEEVAETAHNEGKIMQLSLLSE